MKGLEPLFVLATTPGPGPRFTHRRRASKSGRGVSFLAALLLLGAVSVYLFDQYRGEEQVHRIATAERAAGTLSTLRAGIGVHIRRGSEYMVGGLHLFMAQIVEAPTVLAIELAVVDGPTISSAGDVSLIGPRESWNTADPTATWDLEHGTVAFVTQLEEFSPPHQALVDTPRRGRWERLPPGPYRVVLVLDVTSQWENVRQDRVLFFVIWLMALIAIVSGTATIATRQRRRRLEHELALTQQRAAHQERLTQLSAGLAHETRNPLGVVRGLAQSISGSEAEDPHVRTMARSIVDEVDRAVGQLNRFLNFAKPLQPDPETVALDPFFDRLLPLLKAEADDARVEFSYTPAGLHVLADEEMLRRAILNLAINAVHACEGQGHIRIAARRAHDGVALDVTDDGVGIRPDDLPHVREPYFTRAENGTGLGLAIVERIAIAHQWQLHIDSTPGEGTRVSFVHMTIAEPESPSA